MLSSSATINKCLRRTVSPALRAAGFDQVDARKAWRWLDDCIWVFEIRAVGSYFSDVTGWPSSSVCVWLGVYYRFMPASRPRKVDRTGLPLPSEFECHRRSHLDRALVRANRASLFNPAEQVRTDVWWVERDGANAEEVATEIAAQMRAVALPWYEEQADLPKTLANIEAERDSPVKFELAAAIASRIGRADLAQHYGKLAETATRIAEKEKK